MNSPRRIRRAMWPAAGLLLAAPALADIPWPSECIVPDVLSLVAKDTQGAIDPSAPFTVIVRGFNQRPFPFASVALDFSGCPDLRFCAEQAPGVLVSCQERVLRGFSDVNGEVTFHVAGGATNSGASPGSTGPALNVYADGIFLKTVRVAAFDQDGMDGMDSNDLSAWLADVFSGQSYARSDYNGDGTLDPNDLSQWLAVFFSGASALGCGPACP